jgi:transposase
MWFPSFTAFFLHSTTALPSFAISNTSHLLTPSPSNDFLASQPALEAISHRKPVLGQAFVMMSAERRGSDLDAWLIQAEHCGLPEFQKMARGIRLDYAAVKGAFSSEWSQGQVEAQVNCLKLQKRIVFGRANFDLLRLRVLCRV